MCGIAGIISGTRSRESRETGVGSMCQAMYHRGPDDHGYRTIDEATVGSCRLAIFDPANGRQPMATPDGRWTVVFNGAIYNFRALRDELRGRGWTFRTECDTEVLAAAIAEWGAGCLPRLRGMFAFAAWDRIDHRLLVARDPFGIKPLYYRQRGEDFLFASELNALAAGEEIPFEIDPVGVSDYLAWLAVPAPRTIYRDTFSLRPGEYAEFSQGRLTIRAGWSFADIPRPAHPLSYREFVAQLRGRLTETIRAHLVADVPVGAFLSGGLDSAAVVGLMTEVSGRSLRTFCIGFEEGDYSEARGAEATARYFNAIHHTEVLTGHRVAGDIDRLLAGLDQPTGDGINTYYASQAAKAGGVTVALSGLGGDELFGGYPSFRDTPRIARWLTAWRLVPETLRHVAIDRLNHGSIRLRKLADVLANARDLHDVGSLQRRVFSETGRRRLLHPDVQTIAAAAGPLHPELSTLARELAGARPFEVVSAWELRTYMADVLLRDSDVMSMRHSLELRVPFIDREFIHWLWHQPARGQAPTPKGALFDAVKDRLPPDLAGRQKHGFTLPFPIWMKRELRPFLEDTFSDASVERSGLFASTAVRQLWEGFLTRNDTREWSRVWSLAVLIAFTNRRTVAGTAPPRPISPSAAYLPEAGRTLLMAPEIYASEGGIPRILQLYLRALATTPGRKVRLLALNDAPGDGADAVRQFAPALEAVTSCSRGKARFASAAIALSRGCDTIVCGHIRQLPLAWLARRLNPSLRYYVVAHGIEVWRPFNRAERAALRGAERILCVSDYTRQELLKHCPLPAGRAVVLHNALDPFFHIDPGPPLAHCPPTILVVTRLTFADRYKGVQHMIEAMPEIRARIPQATLRIVGRGDDLGRLQHLRDSLGMQAVVHFKGYLDDASLAAEMRSCRLFALPSRKEGFGLVFLEAMAHGRPCLGARAGGVPEVITEQTGVLVEYGDVPGIASAAVEALQREWNQDEILARAEHFSFASFKIRLDQQLTP